MAFRDYISHNFGWKLLSLLLAALTWLMIQTAFKKEQESPVVTGASTKSFPMVPVTLLSAASNAGRFTVAPATVTVKVSGKQEDLERVQVQDIKAFVDVTETGDEVKFRKTIQVQAPKDLNAAAEPPMANVERVSSANDQN
jgi:hypothetical protein